MANPNRQRLERGHLIAVTLVDGNRASVFIRQPAGGGDHPTDVDLGPFIAGGLSEGEALERVLDIVAIGVRGAEPNNG